MDQLKLFIDLARLKKPIGFMLLFWPCAWGLTLAYDFSSGLKNYISYLILFFIREIQISTNALKLHMSDMDVDVN